LLDWNNPTMTTDSHLKRIVSTNCFIHKSTSWWWGTADGGTVVKVLCYKSEGRWFDSRWCHWNF
jgi:hypothetical protein